jgi:hypothetical protein
VFYGVTQTMMVQPGTTTDQQDRKELVRNEKGKFV